MNRPWFNRNYVIVTAIIVVVIIYGSLYPFDWRVPAHDIGPVATLVGSWAETPGRGDFLSNILLYMPLGLFGALAIADGAGAARRIGLTILLGAALSVSMELTQYYDEGRVTAATDAYSNTIGAALGAIGGCVFGRSVHWRFLDPVRAHRVPVLLLAAWAGYRLFPYVPTNDIHKFWDAIRPIVVHPTFEAYPTFRHTAMWLTVGCAIEAIVGPKRSLLLFPAFVGAMLIAEILIMTIILSVAHIAGAAIALCLWPVLLMGGRRTRAALVALVLCIYVIAARLEPFQFLATAHAFGWIPFLSFMGADRGRHGVVLREVLPLWRPDMASGRGRPAPAHWRHLRRPDSPAHQLGRNPSCHPLGRDHRCGHGVDDRRDLQPDRRRAEAGRNRRPRRQASIGEADKLTAR